MTVDLSENMLPEEIERRSFEIIASELAGMGKTIPDGTFPVVRRVIHATADFDYADNLYFSPDAVAAGLAAVLLAGASRIPICCSGMPVSSRMPSMA